MGQDEQSRGQGRLGMPSGRAEKGLEARLGRPGKGIWCTPKGSQQGSDQRHDSMWWMEWGPRSRHTR